MFKVIQGNLVANSNTIRFTDDTINNNSIFEVYTDKEDIIPTKVSVSEHTATILFDGKSNSSTGVKLLINNIEGEFAPSEVYADDVIYTNPLMQTNNVKDTLDIVVNRVIDIGSDLDDIDTELHTDTVLGGVFYHSTTGNTWKKLDASNLDYDEDSTIYSAIGDIDDLETESKNLVGAVNECFQYVSDGKELIASAITDKGIETLASDSFSTMATNISNISGGDINLEKNSIYYANQADANSIIGSNKLTYHFSSASENLVSYSNGIFTALQKCAVLYTSENDRSSPNTSTQNIYINDTKVDTFNVNRDSYSTKIYHLNIGDTLYNIPSSSGWSCASIIFIKE